MYIETTVLITFIINIFITVFLIFFAFVGFFTSEKLVKASRAFTIYVISCAWMNFWIGLRQAGLLADYPEFMMLNMLLGTYLGPALFLFTIHIIYPEVNRKALYYGLYFFGLTGSILSIITLADKDLAGKVWHYYSSGLHNVIHELNAVLYFLLVLFILTMLQVLIFTLMSMYITIKALASKKLTVNQKRTAFYILLAILIAFISMSLGGALTTIYPGDKRWEFLATVSILPSIFILFFSLYNSRSLLRKTEEIALRNRIIEKELETARLIQKKLLPDAVHRKSFFPIDVTFIPYDKVGGDFYDYFTDERNAFYFIADVSGHGIPGAFLGLVTKLALEYALLNSREPHEVLDIVNMIMTRFTVNDNYATAFFCSVDTESLAMRYCCAGHFPPFIFRRSTGDFFELQSRGMALGWFRNITLETREIQLYPGDRIILFTDGITECQDHNGDMYGIERFQGFTMEASSEEAEVFTEKLMSQLNDFAGDEGFDDDVTLMVIDIPD